jgi:putative transposase
MPRPPRLDLAGIPQHVVQRAVDRRPCFVLDVHYREYLKHLFEQSESLGCEIHAYVLMTNHVHLLATPRENGGIGRLMQSLGRRYVGFFNTTMERSGTLWEGRFKSCLVDSETYLFRCYRYIELNPVRAGMVRQPSGFQWSSYRCNGMGRTDPLVTPHPGYLALGPDREERARAYRAIVAQGCDVAEAEHIRTMTSRNRAFGGEQFRRELEAKHGRPMTVMRRGPKPKKTANLNQESDPN